jgi:hypothetical protein
MYCCVALALCGVPIFVASGQSDPTEREEQQLYLSHLTVPSSYCNLKVEAAYFDETIMLRGVTAHTSVVEISMIILWVTERRSHYRRIYSAAVCSTDPKRFATSSQGTHVYCYVMATLKVTYLLTHSMKQGP